jgi:hypothetical protein
MAHIACIAAPYQRCTTGWPGRPVQTIADSQPSAPPLNKDNRLIPIVVMAPQRLALLPGVPTLKEVGLEPVSRMDGGILAPKGTPKAVVDAVAATAKRILEDDRRAQKHQRHRHTEFGQQAGAVCGADEVPARGLPERRGQAAPQAGLTALAGPRSAVWSWP